MQDILNRIELKNDGVYFLVDYNKANPRKDIITIIDKYEIKNVNYLEIENAINNKEEYILLTRDKNVININESFEIIISDDKVLAEIIFYPPKKNGKKLKKIEVLDKILSLQIKFGLDLSIIDEFLETRDYTKTYIIAQGIPPEKSKDGFLGYFVDINEKKIKPKILEDGSVDYKTLNLFETVKKGTILVTQIAPVKGKNGKDIFGDIVLSEEPKQPPALPKGKNTEISSDGKRLISSINGCVFYRDKLIDILPILEIKSDIDNSTGNIDFVGNVIVRGNVLNGFTINAEGNVNIYGWVEGATIIAEGNIFIAQGVQGAGKAKIVSSKNITLNFVENATLIAEKDINANSIMHCNIFCNGDLTVLGKRGLILGGKSIIGGDLLAKDIGSSMSNNTEITAGINYKVLNKYEELIKSVDIMTERYSTLDKIVEKLSKIDINYLSEDKRILFEKAVKERLEIKKKIVVYKKDIQRLIPLFTKKLAKIQINHKIYGGTKIVANNAIIFLKEDIDSCIIKNVDGKIKVFKL